MLPLRRTLRRTFLFSLLLLLGLAAACGDDDGDGLDSPQGPDSLSIAPTAAPTAAPADPPGPEVAAASMSEQAGERERGTDEATYAWGIAWDESVLELGDGTWQVGDAGEVEFAVRGPNELELLDVRSAGGWTVTDIDIDRDEIEVDFERGNVEWEIEIEIEGGVLEIEIDHDIEPAEPGRYQVGLAGAVEFALANGALQLVDVSPNDGWTYSIEEQKGDEIEVDFRRDNVKWDFEVELDDGQIEIEIDFEIEGRFE